MPDVAGDAPSARRTAPAPPPPSAASSARAARSSSASCSAASTWAPELTVCDITGDWGAYQWSLLLFALAYSTLSVFVVVLGPMLMPDVPFSCRAPDPANRTTSEAASTAAAAATASLPAECFADAKRQVKCTEFVYEQQDYGLMLTNGFDLVCDRAWLRSLITSSALVGMLLSSVTMGLFSDKFGRLRCVQLAFVISCPANLVAMFARDYYLFNACILLMCFAQIGAANALCTLVMEATSPRLRYLPAFEYSFGWAIGMALLPGMHWLTRDFRHFMGLLLIWQLLLLPWLRWGVFESIRWLLSEGHLNRAQIELRRACRLNGVEANSKLAQRIALMQAQQVRKASRVIEQDTAAVRLSEALGARVDETARELDTLSAAIKRSFFGACDEDDNEDANEGRTPEPSGGGGAGEPAAQLAPGLVLSPSLRRASFSVTAPTTQTPHEHQTQARLGANLDPRASLANGELAAAGDRKTSLPTQGLIQLALKYSKTVQRQDEGRCFFVQMFHRKLWRQSTLLLLISVMLETSYYGLLQANKFVGSSVSLNYLFGALSETAAALATCFMLAFCSRRFSIVLCTLVGSLICLTMALSYHLVPDGAQAAAAAAGAVWAPASATNLTQRATLANENLIDNDENLEPVSTLKLLLHEDEQQESKSQEQTQKQTQTKQEVPRAADSPERRQAALVALRNRANFYLMNAGKFFISVGIQVAGIVAMEVYPNNLRQTGPGVILCAGRVGSILAPFLFNDPTPERLTFKLTLGALAAIGLLVCLLVPCLLTNTKNKELCDQLDEIE